MRRRDVPDAAGGCDVTAPLNRRRSGYATIVADPPWHYDGYATMPGDSRKKGHTVKRPDLPYGSMTVDEISALPVRSLAADDGAFVFLWTTNLYLPAAFGVLEEWGFAYKQTLVWHKTGNPSPFGGSVAPNHAEFLLVGSCGKASPVGRLPGSVIAAPKPYEHSLKPDVFLDLIEQVGPRPWVELFARRARFGWEYWGDESLGTADLEGAA
jgi:N6-adenosine-specific RNA methylase IME4